MSRLLLPEELALLVSYVFEVMLTLHCELVGPRSLPEGAPLPERLRALSWRTAVLPIGGSRPLTVVLSSNEQGCLSLGAALFACDTGAVDQEMIDDTLRELVNMIGGQVRSAIAKDESLGLARIDTSFDYAGERPLDTLLRHECVLLRAGSFELAVQVSE